jgi:hypothetical protein
MGLSSPGSVQERGTASAMLHDFQTRQGSRGNRWAKPAQALGHRLKQGWHGFRSRCQQAHHRPGSGRRQSGVETGSTNGVDGTTGKVQNIERSRTDDKDVWNHSECLAPHTTHEQRGGGGREPTVFSKAYPNCNKKRSESAGPSNSSPTGKPSALKAMGTLRPGIPALLAGSVLRI